MSAFYPDADLFGPEAIEDETLEFNRRLEDEIAQAPAITELEPQAIRDAREAGESIFGPVVTVDEATWRTVPGRDREIRVRVIEPEEVQGVYLHLHGGGWTLGAPHHSDVSNLEIARETGLATVSVEYRLAPEHPFPAGLDDCEDAALWVVRNMASEWDTQKMIIGGESAGAHLAVGTLLRLRDRHGYDEFLGANLVYGAYDLAMTPSAANWGERNLVLSTPIIQWFVDHLQPPEPLRQPEVSPLYAGLQGLPRALFTIGTEDPLLDDSLFMHARWNAAGNESVLAVYPGGAHGFDRFPIELAARANRRIHRFLKNRLRLDDDGES
jgi:acetyl esterase/lipase